MSINYTTVEIAIIRSVTIEGSRYKLLVPIKTEKGPLKRAGSRHFAIKRIIIITLYLISITGLPIHKDLPYKTYYDGT